MSNLSDKITRAVVPLSNLPEKTVWVDNLVLNVTETSANGFSVSTVKGRALKDSNGVYSFEVQLEGSKNNNTAGVNLAFTGISGSFNQRCIARNDRGESEFVTGANTFNLAGPTSATTGCQMAALIVLDAEPSWFDANREAGFSIVGQVEEGTPTTAGLVRSITPDIIEGTLTTAGLSRQNRSAKRVATTNITVTDADIAQLRFTGLVVGRVYSGHFQAMLTVTVANSGGSMQIIHDGVILANSQIFDLLAADVTNHTWSLNSDSGLFIATTTTLVFSWNKAGTATIEASAGDKRTFSSLTEHNDTVIDAALI